MDHERCYIYAPPDMEERPSKRLRTTQSSHQPLLSERLAIYHDIWSEQERRIQGILEEMDSTTQDKLVKFVADNAPSPGELPMFIATGLIVAGPSIASHGPFFERLGRRIKNETDSAYVVLTSGESPNLKTFLKHFIKKTTSIIEDDDEYDTEMVMAPSKRGPKLLDFDLGHVQEWQKKNRVRNIVVAIQDSEAFDTQLLIEMVDLFYSWIDRLPFILLFGIATSTESFEDRLSGNSLRFLQGHSFNVTQSDEIVEKLFNATVSHPDIRLQIGPVLSRRILERQKDHVQSVQDFVDSLKYAHMTHFYGNCTTIFLEDHAFHDISANIFEAVRNLPSFRRWVEYLIDNGQAQDVRGLLESDRFLHKHIKSHIATGKNALSSLSHAVMTLTSIRNILGVTPKSRISATWIRAASGELVTSALFRETILSIKKISSDKLLRLFETLSDMNSRNFQLNISTLREDLQNLITESDNSTPLRSQDDVRNESLRTTVVAQKVLLSKHKATLSEQDKAYSEIVAKLCDQLDGYFTSSFIDPRSLVLHEIFMYDLKSPHTEVFQSKPRFAIERALGNPYDYLGCECCGTSVAGGNALSATQPVTAILYQLYLESGTLINASDLWSAFKMIVDGDDEEEEESKTLALFQCALAELRMLGLVKPSRKKTDHIAKMRWKGL